ncbi:MAG: transposase domain-containing protein, partial [Acidiferrobacter sp.]
KNWLFSSSVAGVKASANLYSLIETCKANGLEPYAYLRRVFTDLPQAQTLEDLEALLPHVIARAPIMSPPAPAKTHAQDTS